jgi:EpsI family protein
MGTLESSSKQFLKGLHITKSDQATVLKNSSGAGFKENHLDDNINEQTIRSPKDYSDAMKQSDKAWCIALLILLCVGTFMRFYTIKDIPMNMSLNTLPLQIEDWKGKNICSHKKPFEFEADIELNRIYENSTNKRIELYVAYFTSQKQNKEMIHDGLQQLYEATEEIEISKSSHKPITINKAIYERDNKIILSLYWYDLNGTIISNRYEAKFVTAMEGLIHRRTNGFIIMISSSLNHSGEMEKLLNLEKKFAENILNIMRYSAL